MSTDLNKRLLGRFTEFINTASPELADELIAPQANFHVPGRVEPMIGPSGYLEIVAMMREGFPDVNWTPEEMVAEGDTVAVRFTMRGTHQGTFFGVAPTGTEITVQALALYRLAEGKIVGEHGAPDMLGLLQQIGAFPPA